ncbi:MAG: hypothetical protein Q7S96_02790 [bacterium]|nr:hypothetical protein [bacterium]
MAGESRPPQTRVLAGLVLFGVVAVILGVTQLRTAINRAVADVPTTPSATAADDEETARRTALAAADTDGDGLADLDELERTITSPYLADSDSDGRTDKEEIDAGENPNCPIGKTCVAPLNDTAAPLVAEEVAPPAPVGDATPADAFDLRRAMDQLPRDPASIRQTFREAGIPAAQLEQLTDTQILELWERAMETIEQQ